MPCGRISLRQPSVQPSPCRVMGLFDVFKGGGGGIQKHVARVANKRAQQHERWESIQVLASDGSEEALRALLRESVGRAEDIYVYAKHDDVGVAPEQVKRIVLTCPT